MNINEAISHLISSDGFKEISKQKNTLGSNYRMFLTRFKRDEIKEGAAVDLLVKHGYVIEIKKPK